MANKSLKNSKEMKTHNFSNGKQWEGGVRRESPQGQQTSAIHPYIHTLMHVFMMFPTIEPSSFIHLIHSTHAAHSQNNQLRSTEVFWLLNLSNLSDKYEKLNLIHTQHTHIHISLKEQAQVERN